MKKFAGTWVLALLTILLAAYAYLFEYKKTQEEEEQKERELSVLRLEDQQDKVDRIEIKRRSGSVVLEKDQVTSTWKILEPVQDRAGSSDIDRLLSSILSEKIIQTVKEGPDIKWSDYGLDQPVTQLLVKSSALNKQVELSIGSLQSFDGQLYGRRDQEQALLLLSNSWDVQLTKPPKEFREKKIWRSADAQLANIDKIKILSRSSSDSDARAESLSFELEKIESKWKLNLSSPLSATSSVAVVDERLKLPVSAEAVDSYLRQLQGLRVKEFVSEGHTDADLKKYSLHPAQKPFVVELGNSQKFIFQNQNQNKDPYAWSTELPGVVLLSASAVKELNKSPLDFIDKSYPFIAVSPVRLEVQTANLHMKLQKSKTGGGEDWELASDSPELPAGQELSRDKVKELINQLQQSRAERYLPLIQTQQLVVKHKLNPEVQNKIILTDDKGNKQFEMHWVGPIEMSEEGKKPKASTAIEKNFDGSEMNSASGEKYYLVKTNHMNTAFLMSEAAVESLPISNLLRAKPQAAEQTKK